MGYKATVRAMEAAQRRQQRDVQKRQRELERQNKEQIKRSAIEQARLEVETHENKLEVLLSVHKQQGEIWDWVALASSLPPPCPKKNSNHELKTKQLMLVSTSQQKESAIEQARLETEAGRVAEWQESRDIENDLQRRARWLEHEQASADERWHQRERRLARRGTDASMLSVSDAPETDADNEGA